jgi:hypothetical protein
VIYGTGDDNNNERFGVTSYSELLKRVPDATAMDLRKTKGHNAEDRRVRWLKYKNISMWFDNWENDLVELGTSVRDPISSKVSIPEEQLKNIGNFDETCLSLDGSNNNCGGRPECVIYDPRFPLVGKAMSKGALTTTMISGSTAAGEAYPLHLQFQTKAKTTDTMRLDYDVAEHTPRVMGMFGSTEVKGWPVSFGMNEKGGMDDDEFEKFMLNSIVPLYPNAKNKPGQCVIIKVDSGPGRTNLKLLAKLRMLGFILYPCVPNTTHVTQEMDQCYGPFKTQFLINLVLIVEARINKKKSLSLKPKFVGLPLFGGTDHETEYVMKSGAFQKGFSKRRCLSALKKIGAATKASECLSDPQVLKTSLGVDDEYDESNQTIQKANELAVQALARAGYDRQWLQATFNVEEDEVEAPITQPYTLERQQALGNAKSHGGRFQMTNGGTHVTHDDIFISIEMKMRNEQRGVLNKQKKLRLHLQTLEEKALAILGQEGRSVELYLWKELDMLLGWHQVKSPPGVNWKKEDKLAEWKRIMATMKPHPLYARWTDEDEEKLVNLSAERLDISNTAYGRELALKERELEAAAIKMGCEKRDKLRQTFDELDAEEALASLTGETTASSEAVSGVV